jgi:hypothetical protein
MSSRVPTGAPGLSGSGAHFTGFSAFAGAADRPGPTFWAESVIINHHARQHTGSEFADRSGFAAGGVFAPSHEATNATA